MALRLEDITNRIVASSATLIAAIAMITAVYQSKLMRDQAKAAVWPYLILGSSNNDGYARIIQNVGLGPAVIKTFEVYVKGNPVHTWSEAAESLGIHPSWKGAKMTTVERGIVIPVNATVELMQVTDSVDARQFRAHRDSISTRICYCSLYGDCWTAGEGGYEPQPVKRCTENPKRAFAQ
ncbi:MAG TPA: hypothetical protein VHB25_21255 [Gemmatimonadaceae bacterium]|nr:hypothetical protein [Gemmatimonadaceae bacterium]